MPGVLAEVYDRLIDKLEVYDHNTEMLAVHLLGQKVSEIASDETRAFILRLFQDGDMEKERRNFQEQLESEDVYKALSKGFTAV